MANLDGRILQNKHLADSLRKRLHARNLAKSLLRLQGCKDVLLALPCSKLKN
jgi:hypothetical protein